MYKNSIIYIKKLAINCKRLCKWYVYNTKFDLGCHLSEKCKVTNNYWEILHIVQYCNLNICLQVFKFSMLTQSSFSASCGIEETNIHTVTADDIIRIHFLKVGWKKKFLDEKNWMKKWEIENIFIYLDSNF